MLILQKLKSIEFSYNLKVSNLKFNTAEYIKEVLKNSEKLTQRIQNITIQSLKKVHV